MSEVHQEPPRWFLWGLQSLPLVSFFPYVPAVALQNKPAVCAQTGAELFPLSPRPVSSSVQAAPGFQIQAGDDCHASSACALSLTPPPALQGLHLLQNGQSGQPDRQPRPAADAGCGKILQQRCGPLFQPQQGSKLVVLRPGLSC